MDKWYRLNKILKMDAQYNIIFGERSNGKTFSVLEYILERYVKNREKGAIVRRWRDDFIGKRGQATFEDVSDKGIVTKLTSGEWNFVHYYSSRWYLARYDEEGEGIVKDTDPFCYGFAITTQEHDKSTSYPDVTTIFYDEFITRKGYVNDEFILYMNLLSTIIRSRDNVKIFMIGNTVNKYCPYFAEFGLKHIDKMKQGTIDVYTYGNSALKVAVEYTAPTASGKKSDVYFAFDNPKLNMITTGVWELDVYPHCPYKYKPKDIYYKYYIEFNGYLLQCNMIICPEGEFTFIHAKTSELNLEDAELLFTTKASHELNIRCGFVAPSTNIERKILDHFSRHLVFYATNEVGDTVRNFIQWSTTRPKY